MVSFAGVVIYHVEHHSDIGLVKRFHHTAELEVLPVIVAVTGILRMRRKEVQRHIAPIVFLLGIPLKDGHQLNDGYA